MEYLERNPEQLGVQQEQTRWLIVETALLACERHPSPVWSAADFSMEACTEVLHARLPDGASESEVTPHRRRQLRDVGLRENRHCDGVTNAPLDFAFVLGAEAEGPCDRSPITTSPSTMTFAMLPCLAS
jgi:hypothetical protein